MPFNWNQACCNKCNEQYSLPKWSIADQEMRRDVTCPKCTENQRKCDLLTREKELQKEKNEEKRIELQLEKEKRATLLAVETKRSETIIAKAKIKEENDYKKLQLKAAMQAKQHKHELELQDRRQRQRSEEKRLDICRTLGATRDNDGITVKVDKQFRISSHFNEF